MTFQGETSGPLTHLELEAIDAYWRASLYPCAGMLYLREAMTSVTGTKGAADAARIGPWTSKHQLASSIRSRFHQRRTRVLNSKGNELCT